MASASDYSSTQGTLEARVVPAGLASLAPPVENNGPFKTMSLNAENASA